MEFNTEKVTDEIVSFIKDYYQKNNLNGAVIGLSGGKDSAVCHELLSGAQPDAVHPDDSRRNGHEQGLRAEIPGGDAKARDPRI